MPELIDELATEKLPAALMDPILTERRARHEQRRAAATARAEAKARVDELEPRLEQLDAKELDELERLADVARGQYTAAVWQLRDKIRRCQTTLTDATTTNTDAEHDNAGGDVDEDLQRPVDEDAQPDVDLAGDEGARS